MEFKVINTNGESLKIFLHNIFLLYTKKYNWLNRDPFILPESLKKKVIGKTESQLANISELIEFHKSCFEDAKKPRREISSILKNISKNYGTMILKEIERETKVKWELSKVKLVLAAYRGGTNYNSNVVVGFYGDVSMERFIKLVTHEAIHLNTLPLVKDLIKKPGIITDANELLTVFKTNKVINKLNDEFKLQLNNQEYHKTIPEFEKFKISEDRFDKDLCKLQNFLNKEGIQGKYKVT